MIVLRLAARFDRCVRQPPRSSEDELSYILLSGMSHFRKTIGTARGKLTDPDDKRAAPMMAGTWDRVANQLKLNFASRMKVPCLETKVRFVVVQRARRDLRLMCRANRFSGGRSGAPLFAANVASCCRRRGNNRGKKFAHLTRWRLTSVAAAVSKRRELSF
jgi:hypothetical protein